MCYNQHAIHRLRVTQSYDGAEQELWTAVCITILELWRFRSMDLHSCRYHWMASRGALCCILACGMR